MNTNNLIKVQTMTDNSSGYFFKSYDDKKSFVITSKHSICEFRSTCDLIKNSVKDCCRNCSLEFDAQKIHLLSSNDVSLRIEKIYYDKAKDLVILNVSETANDTLIINEQSISDYYVSFGFNSSDSGITPLVFDVPRVVDTLIYYNLHSNPTPNLIEKEDNFKGISGSVIFTDHEKYPTAKALIIHNETHNDFGAENLEKLDFDSINDFFKCHVFQRVIDTEQNELKELSKRNKDWLLECFSSNREAKHFLGQPLAPNDKNLTKLLPRKNIINRIHESIYKQNLIFVLGNEGVGKSWVAARNWLTMMKKPLHLFLSAQKLGDLDINNLESFLIKKIIEQTNETSNDLSIKKWKDRFEKWGNLSDEGNIDLLVTIDGINQKPNINWSEVINNLTYFFKNKNVKILVTSRTIFFNERVKRKISDEYEVVTVSDWTTKERDEILIEKKINPKSLSASVAQSLLNPRLLNIALSLFDTKKIQKIDELDVNRILLEHIRRMESDNYENITYTDFLVNLQTHAKEIIDRLEDEDDDLNYFNGQLDAVAEGHFFEVIEDDLNAYKLKDEGLSFALGLEIVLQLNKMKRNRRSLDDGLAKIIDPINALDKTSDIIISSLTILIFESNYYSKELLTALIKCFVSLQNTNDSYLNYFTCIVEKKISDFMNILEELCLDGGRQPNIDWVRNSIIYISNNSFSSWKLMEEDIKKWLSFYSLSPERKLSYFPSKNTSERLSTIEKNKQELEDTIHILSDKEMLLKNSLIEKDGDIDKLATTAFYILAGKPLINFTLMLIRWSFGCSLNSSYESPRKDFINLIQYNLVDWEETRQKLLRESRFLDSSDVSKIAQWAYIRILISTGEKEDAVLADRIAQRLHPKEDLPGSWRLIEDYCETDPCDPNSIRPQNINNTIEVCKKLDITNMWNSQYPSQENITLQYMETGLARFSPNILISIYKKLILRALKSSQYALYYGVHNTLRNSILLEQCHIDQLLKLGSLKNKLEIFRGLLENYESFIKQYSFIISYPFLTPEKQLNYLLAFQKGEDVFIGLFKNTSPVSSSYFSEILSLDLKEHQILHLIYYANIHKLELSITYKQFLKENINHKNPLIRQEVFRAISLYEDIDLLKNFIDSQKLINDNSDIDSHEDFFASLLWLSAIKYEVIDISIAIQHVHPWAYRYASNYLPSMSLSKIAELLDELIHLISQLDIDIPNLTIIENISDSYEMDISLFSIDKKKVDQDFIESIKFTSESEKEFDKRQEEQHQEFCKYTDYLRDLDIEFILRGMHPKEFEKIANSNPVLCDKWFHLIINHSVTKLADKFYNLGILLAYVYSDTDIKKSIQLWNKFHYSEGYSEIIVGVENISLQLMSIWGKSNPELDKYRFNLLDQASSDAQIYNIVFAAILNNNENAIIKYISTKIQKVEPSQIARGILVAGCLDENPMSEKIFQRFKNYKGLIGDAYNAALYMYERNKWAKHWFEKMISTDSHDDFWCNMVLFTKIVDSRYYIWKKNFTTNESLYQKFYFSFENKIKNRCNKWEKKRGEKLFGTERPPSVYLYSNYQIQ